MLRKNQALLTNRNIRETIAVFLVAPCQRLYAVRGPEMTLGMVHDVISMYYWTELHRCAS